MTAKSKINGKKMKNLLDDFNLIGNYWIYDYSYLLNF
jgi:hypothetical protein